MYNNYVINIMFYFRIYWNISYLTGIESVTLWYFWIQMFDADKEIHNLTNFYYAQRSATNERWSTSRGQMLVVM